MIDRSEAEEHLRVIRSLMEKATIYRAISAPAALFAGAVATGVGSFLIGSYRNSSMDFVTFLAVWSGVLIIVGVANFFFLWREAKARGEIFISPGMRLALRAMMPTLACGGLISVYSPAEYQLVHAAILWVIFYGLALLGTSHFAPRSITALGGAFTLVGIFFVTRPLALLSLPFGFLHAGYQNNFSALANALMVLCFGLFHIVYAIGIIWSGQKRPVERKAPAAT